MGEFNAKVEDARPQSSQGFIVGYRGNKSG
jgi:hypothetical protein